MLGNTTNSTLTDRVFNLEQAVSMLAKQVEELRGENRADITAIARSVGTPLPSEMPRPAVDYEANDRRYIGGLSGQGCLTKG